MNTVPSFAVLMMMEGEKSVTRCSHRCSVKLRSGHYEGRMSHIIFILIKPSADPKCPADGRIAIPEETPPRRDRNVSSQRKGDHSGQLSIDFQ